MKDMFESLQKKDAVIKELKENIAKADKEIDRLRTEYLNYKLKLGEQ